MIYYVLGIFVGYFFWKFFAGKKEGDKKERSIIFCIGEYSFHIHHWIFSLVLLVVFFVLDITSSLLFGILIGSIIQGLSYKDRFLFFYKTRDYEKIYKKFK